MYELANCVDDVKTAIQHTKTLLTAEAVRRVVFYFACLAFAFLSRMMAIIQETPLKIAPKTEVERMMVW